MSTLSPSLQLSISSMDPHIVLPYPVDPVAERVYNILAPMAVYDPAASYSLLAYIAMLAYNMEEVANLAETDTDGEVGWSKIIDITRCPDKALPWLAQFVGVYLPPGISADDQRQRIQATDGWNRGTPAAIMAAPAPFLTGTKSVLMRERFDPGAGADPYHLQVVTKTSETPDTSTVLAALMAQKPAGIVLHYSTMVGQDFEILWENHASFQAVFTYYATFEGVYTDTQGA